MEKPTEFVKIVGTEYDDELIKNLAAIKLNLFKESLESEGLWLGQTDLRNVIKYENDISEPLFPGTKSHDKIIYSILNNLDKFSLDLECLMTGFTMGNLYDGPLPDLGGPTPFAGITSDAAKYAMVGCDGLNKATAKGSTEIPNEVKNRGLLTEVALPTGGKFIVNKYIANDLIAICSELKALPGWKGGPTNCFRTVNSVSGGTSKHCYGCAVDVNPGTGGNPWFGVHITPDMWHYNSKGRPSWPTKACPYKGAYDPNRCIWSWDHPVVKIFARHGWGWGGAYGDVMHFSIFTYPTSGGMGGR